MVSKLTFLSLGLAVFALDNDNRVAATVCQKYDCASSRQSALPQQCAYQDTTTNTIYYKHCASNQTCPPPVAPTYNSTCTTNPTTQTVQVNGEFCGVMNSVNYVCQSPLQCSGTTGYCTLNNSNSTTLNGSLCAPKTYYDATTQKCVAELAAGAGCTTDDQCPGNMFCYALTKTGSLTCQGAKKVDNNSMFYITAGAYQPQPMSTYGDNLYLAYPCEDLVAYSNSTDTTQFTCTSRPELDYTKTCTADSDCKLKDISKQVPQGLYSTCQCSGNTDGTQYCAPSFGDSAVNDYLDELEDFVKSSTALKCNNANKLSAGCYMLNGSSDTKKWMAKIQYATYYVEIKKAKSCAVETLYPAYWAEDSASYLIAAAFLMIFA